MNTIPRSAGIGLLVYAVGTTAGFVGAGGPGGDYESAIVAGYVDPSHYASLTGVLVPRRAICAGAARLRSRAASARRGRR